MTLTYFTARSFKKKQIVTTERNKGHEDQPFVDFVSFCSKSLFLAGVLLFLGLATSVQAQYTYVTNNGSITITGYTGSGGMVTIPGMIDGLAVTDIGTNAFQGTNVFEGRDMLSGLTSVIIPDSVTNIGDYAFYNCSQLTNVTFGDRITSIGNSAFSGQYGGVYFGFISCPLTTVTIPSSVTNIGIAAFEGCPLSNVTIPNSVTSIGDYAFFACQALTNVTMAEGLASIGAYAFSGWISTSLFGPPPPGACPLTSITIPSSVTNIGVDAFEFCANLTAINVASNNPAYSTLNGVLFNKTQTTLVEYPDGLAGSYAIPSGVSSIASNAFNGCGGLTSVTIPASVLTIGAAAFEQCGSLANVTLSLGLVDIGSNAFTSSSVTSVTIPGSVISIGDYAFSSCRFLTNVIIEDGVTHIGAYAFFFAFSSGITQAVTIPDSVTNIGTGAFSDGNSLTAITVAPGNPAYSSLGGVLFNQSQTTLIAYPNGLGGTYAIPENVTNIGDYAFYYCGVTSITIPDSVTSIGNNAFAGCDRLTAINVASNNPAYSTLNGVLFNKTQTTLVEYPDGLAGSYAIPSGVSSIGDYAFESCGLASISVPASVTNIGDYAFQDCGNLTSACFLGNAPSADTTVFSGGSLIVYAPAGASGWSSTFAGAPVELWDPMTSLGYTVSNGTVCIVSILGFNTSLSIPGTLDGLPVTGIGVGAFASSGLTSVVIPGSVTSIGQQAFGYCKDLTSAYFLGNAPGAISTSFSVPWSEDPLTAYYLPGTTGWAEFTTNTSVPTALWTLPYPLILNGSSGVLNNQFGFTISWATNVPVVVEASTGLSNPAWAPIATNTLSSGTSYFSDPNWTNYPNRFYRLRSQ